MPVFVKASRRAKAYFRQNSNGGVSHLLNKHRPSEIYHKSGVLKTKLENQVKRGRNGVSKRLQFSRDTHKASHNLLSSMYGKR